MQGGAEPAGPPPPPLPPTPPLQSLAHRAASPFRARHAAAILFTSRPRPAPPRRRTPVAEPIPHAADAPARWLSLLSPSLCPPHSGCRLGRLDPGGRPSWDWLAPGPAPRVETARPLAWQAPVKGGEESGLGEARRLR